MPGDASKSLASMGIYVFDADYLSELLAADDNDDASSPDFGKSIIPQNPREGIASAHPSPLPSVQCDPPAQPDRRLASTPAT